MDYFQGVVTEYLRADRCTFVNTELLIQLEPGDIPGKGRHWYCDAAAANFDDDTFYLCEVTYSKSMQGLANRLLAWNSHWKEIRLALTRDCKIPSSWQIIPWVFIPQAYHDALKRKIISLENNDRPADSMPRPQVTYLESVVPWNYKTWDRKVVALEDEA